MKKKLYNVVVLVVIFISQISISEIVTLKNGLKGYDGCTDTWEKVHEEEKVVNRYPNVFKYYEEYENGTGTDDLLRIKNVLAQAS